MVVVGGCRFWARDWGGEGAEKNLLNLSEGGPSVMHTGTVVLPPQTLLSEILSRPDGKEELTRMWKKVN